MADGYCAVGTGAFLECEQRDRFADDQAAADDHDVLAFEIDATPTEQLHDACGGTGSEASVVILRDLTEIDRAETVDVFFRGNAAKYGGLINAFRQR